MENSDDYQENGEVPDGAQGFENFNPPSAEDLLALLDQMKGLSDEDREQIKQDILMNQKRENPEEFIESQFTTQSYILLSLILIFASLFVFFGYKLYKSLKDKERKRDEKKKLRQQKKKK